MQVNFVGSYESLQKTKRNSQSFGNAYVTLTKSNLADVISKTVDTYNKGDLVKMYEKSRQIAQKVIDRVNATLKNSTGKISTVDDLIEKTDFYVQAGGAGSRFKEMSSAVAQLRNKGEQFNKISVPFELGNGQKPLTMLDIPMTMGRFFAPATGYEKIVAEQQTGSFGDVIKNYISTTGNCLPKRAPRDVVVCCGDNVFDMKGEKLLEYIVRTINNPQKQLGVVGVVRTPEEVAGRFGVLNVGKQNPKTGLFSLKGFVEKPSLEQAKSFTTADGTNIANTGMFVIKKESMSKLLDTIAEELRTTGGKTTVIAKNDKEIYDFATATKWTQALNGEKTSDVLTVKRWEDVGEPKAYQRWIEQLKQGHYLENFTDERKQEILKAVKDRVKNNSIQFSLNPKGKKIVDGIEIIA